MFTRAQTALLVHAALLTAAMAVAVPLLTSWLGGPRGYLAAMALYWIGFCLPVIVFHTLPNRAPSLLSPRLPPGNWWVPLLLVVQVGLICGAALLPHAGTLSLGTGLLATGVAVINGSLEELAWRGGFIGRFGDRPRFGLWAGWLLFSAWHLPLTLSHGIVFDGGGLSLVGGAAALGLLWTWLAWRTRSVFWVAIAHVLTNIATFWPLFAANGFA